MPYNRAISDYMKRLRVKTIDLSAYRGNPGDEIRVVHHDPYLVTRVTLAIFDHRGNLVEDAIADPLPGTFQYGTRTIVPNPSYDRGTIVVKVSNKVTVLTDSFDVKSDKRVMRS